MNSNSTPQRVLVRLKLGYEASPRILDFRAAAATKFLASGYFDGWSVEGNEFIFTNPTRSISFDMESAECLVRLADAVSLSLVELLFEQLSTFAEPDHFRLEVFYVVDFGLAFAQLLRGTIERSLNSSLTFAQKLRIVDVGWLFDVMIVNAKSLLRVGPMPKEQIVQYIFSGDSLGPPSEVVKRLPEAGLFIGLTDQSWSHMDLKGVNSLRTLFKERLAKFDQLALELCNDLSGAYV